MTDAEAMMALFAGSDLAHGRSDLTNTVSSKGKHETKCWTEKRPVTVQDWEKHLAGAAGIGIPPLSSNNQVMFGAIDVDVYNGLSIETLNQKIHAEGIPLVVCRSKSGGPHLYLFLKEWIEARLVLEKLDAIAGYLGFGTSEIFPKQATISQADGISDFGSWINMPYFGGTKFLRYALDAESRAIATIPEFITFAKSRALSKEQFLAYQTPQLATVFPDGPPCLNQLFATPPTEFRNVLLSNAAVYAKKAFPDTWKAQLDRFNTQFGEPLPSDEVEAIKKSYDKKDYRYQCSKPPLCNFCNSSACRRSKYGIGGEDFLPAQRSLTRIETSPVIWFLDLEMPNGKTERISLTTEQLHRHYLFQRRCMETIRKLPPTIKTNDWEAVVQQLIERSTTVEMPPEMSPKGQFLELFWEFLQNRAQQESWECLIRGIPYLEQGVYHFRMRDLTLFLQRQKFTAAEPNLINTIIKQDLKAARNQKIIAGKHVRYLSVVAEREETGATLATPEFKADY